MMALGVFLLGLGIVAAWNVHGQQQANSAMINHEVYGMLAVSELHMTMREIRYQLNLFLRTHDPQHLANVTDLHDEADGQLGQVLATMRTDPERTLVERTDAGYRDFFARYQRFVAALPQSALGADIALEPNQIRSLEELSDTVLTETVLGPLRDTLRANRDVLVRTEEAGRATAQHLKIGFLLLGLCGGLAGLLLGTAIARTIGHSIVQLIVSVRGVAGKLSDVGDPVVVSHVGDLSGLDTVVRGMEGAITGIVERLQQRETELLRSEQLARVGQLAAGMAHELRNPLMPMKMLVQSARERDDGAGLRGRSLEIVNDEIGRLERSIQLLLDFARPPVPERRPTDLRAIASSTVDLVSARAAGQGVAIHLDAPGVPVIAQVDAAQIRQLLLNLLLNALDAQPHGGEIDIGIDASLEGWTVVVEDGGPGIPAANLAGIFEPFVTEKDTGTGLGLTISSRIAAAHGGSLVAGNAAAGGARFVLRIPAAA